MLRMAIDDTISRLACDCAMNIGTNFNWCPIIRYSYAHFQLPHYISFFLGHLMQRHYSETIISKFFCTKLSSVFLFRGDKYVNTLCASKQLLFQWLFYHQSVERWAPRNHNAQCTRIIKKMCVFKYRIESFLELASAKTGFNTNHAERNSRIEIRLAFCISHNRSIDLARRRTGRVVAAEIFPSRNSLWREFVPRLMNIY